MADKVVENKCPECQTVELSTLTPLVPGFRRIGRAERKKLIKVLTEKGLYFPLYVWKNKKANKIIDGVHRTIVLNDLQKRGYEIPPIPVVFIEAKTQREAEMRIPYASSRYAHADQESFNRFLSSINSAGDVIERISIRGVNVDIHGDMTVRPIGQIRIKFNTGRYKKFLGFMDDLRHSENWKSDAEIILKLLEGYINGKN